MLEIIHSAEKDNIDILVFPELAVTGNPVGDLMLHRSFIELCQSANKEIIENTGNTTLVFGTVTQGENTNKLRNSVIIAQNGSILAQSHKQKLQNVGIFSEWRYFESGDGPSDFKIGDLGIEVAISDDIENLKGNKEFDLVINPTSIPFTKSVREKRLARLQETARENETSIIFINNVGGNAEYIFDGGSLALDKKGNFANNPIYFDTATIDIEFSKAANNFNGEEDGIKTPNPYHRIEACYEALKLGVKDYLKKSKAANKVLIGLSGGIDSTLTCAIAVDALGAENVVGVTMPSEFSSARSVIHSRQLANNLGIEFHEMSIKNIYNTYIKELHPFFEGKPFDVAEENIQARIRGDLLMALANKFGYMVLTNGNKSELAVGYCTLYGDMAGGLAVIGDLYKTEVVDMCNWINTHRYKKEVIPESVINKPPSAELRPDQVDSDTLPDYAILDGILLNYIDNRLSGKQIIEQGYAEEIVSRILRLVDINEHKRRQAAPVLKLSEISFGNDRNWSLI